MASDYLWDRSGPVDPEIEELESELSQLSCEARDRSLDPPRTREPAREHTLRMGWLAVAASPSR